MSKGILRPLKALHQGAAKVAVGDLYHQIGNQAADELGSLARAFDNMVVSLRTTTTSRDALNREIEGHASVEKELRESEQRFRDLAESVNEVFWMTSGDGREMLYVSPAYERVWQQTCESLLANPHQWQQCIHPDDRNRVDRAFYEEAALGTFDEQYRVNRPDGTIRWIRDRSFPIKNEEGRVLRISGIAEDITELKEVEQYLQMSKHLMETLNRQISLQTMLDEFVDELRDITHCQAVGIRLLEEDGGIPYQAHEGFSQAFYELENPLSIHAHECMCITVMTGKAETSLPFYTELGSFFMDSTSTFRTPDL